MTVFAPEIEGESLQSGFSGGRKHRKVTRKPLKRIGSPSWTRFELSLYRRVLSNDSKLTLGGLKGLRRKAMGFGDEKSIQDTSIEGPPSWTRLEPVRPAWEYARRL